MGEIFKPDKSKKERIEKLAKELQISEEEAEKVLKRRKSGEEEGSD